MKSTTQPAQPETALLESPSDPYCGTPLGVEAAWYPNGADLPQPAGETPTRSMEL